MRRLEGAGDQGEVVVYLSGSSKGQHFSLLMLEPGSVAYKEPDLLYLHTGIYGLHNLCDVLTRCWLGHNTLAALGEVPRWNMVGRGY